ncbi:MAG: hypothetical protein A2052_00925 [Deltaproteobacteria bacterium GWA2_54_12]|nr:MAG: hypothetical protein A2052_00925 [Deltaproteobacteria bacterium GWA2_54_12]
MYAFVIWDEKKHGFLLARDPFGIKPLYYADDGKTLRVASQVKALLVSGQTDTSPEPAGHVGFYLWGHVPDPYTLYKGIHALPAGSILWVEEGDTAGRKETRRFFNIAEEITSAGDTKASITREEMHERLRAALLDSMYHHLIADVPIGIFLSAGLDSTTMVAMAKDAGMNDLRTITLGFKEFTETQNDETSLAQQVAQQYGAQHQTQWVQKEDFIQSIGPLLTAMDQPSIDGVNSYFVCKAAKEAGLKVALSGLGGDELFGGYPDFQQIPCMVRALRPFHAVPRLGRGFRYFSAPILKHFTSPKYAGLLEYGSTYGGAYLLRRGLYMPWELPDVLDADLVRQGWRELQTLDRLKQTTAGVLHPHFQVMGLEMVWYMQYQLLRDSDWASMAHSMELRVPLVDIELFRKVTRLIDTGFTLSKREMASTPLVPLPDAVLNRKKTGFSIPVREWLPGLDEGQSGGNGCGLRPWARWIGDQFRND